MRTEDQPVVPALRDPDSATIDTLGRLDIHGGRVVAAQPLASAWKPAYRLRIDFEAAGTRDPSAWTRAPGQRQREG